MSNKLRDLIRNVRQCKTAAEERALIQKEKALIRESFRADETEYRPRNVAKLLFISMLGHDTDFGQMECLNLITASSYTEKRIGYLGLTQLFNEKSEVLMMATNRIRIDLNNQSNYIVALALMALSEICTTDMCRDLAPDVLKLLQNGTAYIKKKAALASTRIVTRVPERLDDFAAKVEMLLEDRHHGVLVASLQLCQHIIHIQGEYKMRFVKFVAPMVRIFKSIYQTYSAEYDIGGVSDPFLQIEILKFFRSICAGNKQLSDEVSDILTQVAANTNNPKNAGNAVLYECVKTIFAIESSNTLKTLAINILGKFLGNKDANSKYISLFMLQKVLKHDVQSVQKYKITILDCLKENDNSIKTLALDLLYMITNESNVKTIVKELLNYLLDLNDEDAEFISELTNKICQIVENYAPSRRWYIDIIIKVLILAGNYVSEESSSALIHLIIGTAELQSYAVHKLFFSLQQKENMNQIGLARTTAYCIGDFGHLLLQGNTTAIDGQPITITEDEVIALLADLLEKENDTIKEYTLSALIKLFPKLKTQQNIVKKLIQSQVGYHSTEVAKRAQEYIGLLEGAWDQHRIGICEQAPACNHFKRIYEDKPIGDTDIDEYPPQEKSDNNIPQKRDIFIAQPEQDNDILKVNSEQKTPTTGVDPFDILNIYAQSINPIDNQQQQQQQIPSANLITDLYGSSNFQFQQQPQQPQQQQQQQQQQQKQQQQQQQQQQIDLTSLYGISMPQQYQQHYNEYPQQIPNIQTQFNNPAVPTQIQQQSPLLSPPLAQSLQPAQQQSPLQSPPIAQQQQTTQQQSQPLSFTAFDDGALEVQFNSFKEAPDSTHIQVNFSNNTGSNISELFFQVAVLKYLKLQMTPPSKTVINANTKNTVNQTLKVKNSQQGVKGIVMKLKIGYVLNGIQINREATCQQFPSDY